MAREYDRVDPDRHGKLIVKESRPNCVEIFYAPAPAVLEQSGLNSDEAADYRVKLMKIDGQNRNLTIWPTNTLGGHENFGKPKHRQVESITLADGVLVYADVDDDDDPLTPGRVFRTPCFGPTRPLTEDEIALLPDITNSVPSTPEEVMTVLENLPPAFTKDYDYGLGLAKPYWPIVQAVETLSTCTQIVISRTCETSINPSNEIFYINTKDFDTIRKALNGVTNLAQKAATSVKRATAYNNLARRIGVPEIAVETGRHPLRKLFTETVQGKETLTEDQQQQMISAVSQNIRPIAEANAERLAQLQSDIELVTLEHLIVRYAMMIEQRLTEANWQLFFFQNPFILNLAFGYPVIKIQDQASVGGRKLSGSGDKVADFVFKNRLTNNTAIFEIKTPQANLLNKTPFRSGIYTPSSDLSGAINQALDQKYQFQTHISTLKHNTRSYDMESYSVHCCLIIGTIPSDEDEQKSFELFRGNSKDVEIVTFDELLEKLKQLRDFLDPRDTAPEVENLSFVEPIEPPF